MKHFLAFDDFLMGEMVEIEVVDSRKMTRDVMNF